MYRGCDKMNAKDLVAEFGEKLVGRIVLTAAMGEYPGGFAQVVEINPDPMAPEIVFNAQNSAWMDDWGSNIIGVFEDEDVELEEGLI